jgi:hypothetical protein
VLDITILGADAPVIGSGPSPAWTAIVRGPTDWLLFGVVIGASRISC